jgi:NAD(P)H-dependent FMN reductase
MPSLMIVIATTRPARAGIAVAEWFIDRARAHDAFEVDVVDLAELNLPFLDEPNHPRLGQYTQQHTRDWSARVTAADAFVFITAEYNHGYPATLKNAIDFLHWEWKDKPVGFVSYGGVAAGTRALQQLKPVVSVLKMVPISEAVNVPFFAQFIDEDGALAPNQVMEQSASAMLDELQRLNGALALLRSNTAVAGA